MMSSLFDSLFEIFFYFKKAQSFPTSDRDKIAVFVSLNNFWGPAGIAIEENRIIKEKLTALEFFIRSAEHLHQFLKRNRLDVICWIVLVFLPLWV